MVSDRYEPRSPVTYVTGANSQLDRTNSPTLLSRTSCPCSHFPPAGPSLEDRDCPLAIEGNTHDLREIGPPQPDSEEGALYYDP